MDLLDDLLHAALFDLAPGTAASITLIGGGHAMTAVASEAKSRLLDAAQYTAQHGPCLQAIARKAPVVVVDFAVDPRWPSLVDEADALGIRSSLSVPLQDTDGLLGGLNLYGPEPHTFGRHEVLRAEELAARMVVALRQRQQVPAVSGLNIVGREELLRQLTRVQQLVRESRARQRASQMTIDGCRRLLHPADPTGTT